MRTCGDAEGSENMELACKPERDVGGNSDRDQLSIKAHRSSFSGLILPF